MIATDIESEGGAILLEAQAICTPIVTTLYARTAHVVGTLRQATCRERRRRRYRGALRAEAAAVQPGHMIVHYDIVRTAICLEEHYARVNEKAVARH